MFVTFMIKQVELALNVNCISIVQFHSNKDAALLTKDRAHHHASGIKTIARIRKSIATFIAFKYEDVEMFVNPDCIARFFWINKHAADLTVQGQDVLRIADPESIVHLRKTIKGLGR